MYPPLYDAWTWERIIYIYTTLVDVILVLDHTDLINMFILAPIFSHLVLLSSFTLEVFIVWFKL